VGANAQTSSALSCPIPVRNDQLLDGRGYLPFSKHYIIEPECIEAMRAAFYKVCDALLLNGDVDDPMTEAVVDKIVALAKGGEHDADRLAWISTEANRPNVER